jgi:hypothetical protein
MHGSLLPDAESEGRLMVAPSVLRRHKTTHGRVGREGQGSGQIVLGALHPAHRSARSIFPSRIFDPVEVKRVLKDGHQSRKIGKFVDKGPRRGWPIFTLTLEERATCPRTCRAWSFCFGNNMQAAERISAGEQLLEALTGELEALQTQHPHGFMVRLHVLGDFYSLEYVRFWAWALERFPALHIFGFTARLPGTEIGDALWDMAEADWARFAIRFSGMAAREKASILQGDGESRLAIPCPAQTEATDCCATCGLCWHSKRSILFARH